MQHTRFFRVSAALATAALLFGAAVTARSGTLDRVREQGKLTIGYVSDARPFSYEESPGRPGGYSIALCGKVADAVKAELKLSALTVDYAAIPAADRIDAVKQGRVDILCAEATVTLARRRDVAFSIPIFASGIGALLRSDSPARLREALSGKPQALEPRWRATMAQVLQRRVFAAVAGTTAEAWVRERKVALDIVSELTPVTSYDAGVQSVLIREADVFFADRPILLDAVKRSPSASDLVVLDRLFTYEPLALMLERGDEDFRLVVDRTLSELYRSGEIGGLYAKYFGEPDENALSLFRLSAEPE